MFDTKKLALFLGGVVFGSAGSRCCPARTPKDLHPDHCCGAVDEGLHHADRVNKVQEEAGDILADAKAINEKAAPPRLHTGGHRGYGCRTG